MWGEMLNHAAGPGQVYLALTGQIPWTAPAFQAAIEQLDAMQQRGWFMGGLDRLLHTAPFDESRAALGDGKAAMNIEGTWFLSLINNYFGAAAGNSNEWAAAPVPSQNGDAIFDLGIGSTYAINAATPHPDAAVDFITYFFAPATQAILVTQCGFAPAPGEPGRRGPGRHRPARRRHLCGAVGRLGAQQLRLHHLDLLAAAQPGLSLRRDREGLGRRHLCGRILARSG
jgi:ABC-type glycerol-3-phosphate transport system substrate-binding protein